MSTDKWGPSYRELGDPSEDAYVPTKNIDLPVIGKAIYVTSAGNLVVRGKDGSQVDFGAVTAGMQIAFRATFVENGTTAGILILA